MHQENEAADVPSTSSKDTVMEPKPDATSLEESDSDSERMENPMGRASFLSRLFFTWPYPLLKLGMERPLQDDDLPDILEADTSQFNLNEFKLMWQEEKKRRPNSPSLHRAMLVHFFQKTWFVQPMMMASLSSKVIQAIALGRLVDTFEMGTDGGYLWASVLVACAVVILFEHHHAFFYTWRKGMQLRIASVAAIHDKSLRLSSTHQDTSASYGRIMNLASNDVERFLLASLFISHIFWAPIQAIAILIVGSLLIGPAFMAGGGLLVFAFAPLQYYLSGKFAYYRSKIANITDQRVSFVSQAVRGVRVMKISGYEFRFLERIQELRRDEVAAIRRVYHLKSWTEAIFFSANIVISVVIFAVHVFSGGTLQPGDVFAVFTLVNVMQLEVTKHVSLGVMGVSESYVSITRIQEFLEFPELPSITEGAQQSELVHKDDNAPAISMSNVKCFWNDVKRTDSKIAEAATDRSGSTLFLALEDISIDFHYGKVTAVIGTVGSGKSALLQAIVQELPVSSGGIRRRYSTLAYASQDPWIMDGTVKENIIMGMDVDEDWYLQVVMACALVPDFQQFRDGDQTIVGDRGVQCSGGQRARIGLARAMYRDADVLVLDDPLSAVDAKVGRHLFQEAIIGLGVKRNKCVILATHQHQYISECTCLLIAYGRIECTGSYEACVAASMGKLTAHTADDAIDNLQDDEQPITDEEKNENKRNASVAVGTRESTEDDQAEANVKGLVSLDTYLNYLNAMGGVWMGVILVVLFCATQASALATIAFVGRWAERPAEEQDDWDIIGLVFGMTVLVVILAITRAVSSLDLMLKASRRLHDRMAEAVLRAKISFFDTNPLGRILNRFSADIGSTDDLLPTTLFDFSVILCIVLGSIATTLTTLPFALAVLPFLCWYFLQVRRVFVTSTRELKRLEGMGRSPIFAMLGEALGGIATIRTNDGLDFFKKKFRKAHDAHTRAFFCFISSSRWAGFRMDSLVFVFLTAVTYLSVLVQQKGWFNVDPAILGLAISMLLYLAGIFQWCIRQSAEVVNQMVSVERVLAYGELEPEALLEKPLDKAVVAKGWPSQGGIEFEDFSVRYRQKLPLVLENVSFKIPPGSRVGIVGRTGSGKSTIVQTLFRLLEAEHGRIVIDDEDISSLGLHALRTKISVIPQMPTLFSGCTIRENLDLFGLYSDEEISHVLNVCHMGHVVKELPNGWDSTVSEGGSNFSVGQRQLLCLARALLSKNKIMILDEATASVDRRTDHLLQETLNETFHNGTILAVAHRLDTVIDSDYILVLGKGRVLEFGPPAQLLRKQNGAFASMVVDTGDTMSQDLQRRALEKEKQDLSTTTK